MSPGTGPLQMLRRACWNAGPWQRARDARAAFARSRSSPFAKAAALALWYTLLWMHFQLIFKPSRACGDGGGDAEANSHGR